MRIDTPLRRGAPAAGFPTDVWTVPRVAQMIARLTGEQFHPSQVWRLLRALGWSVQRPARQARERDEAAIQRWRRQRLAAGKKNARRRRAWLVFEDESGLAQQPVVRRTWAPRGETPVLRHTLNSWKRLSVATAPGFRGDGRRARLYFQTRPGTYTTAPLIAFLRTLKRHLRSRPVILLWDRLGAHKNHQI